MDGGPNQNLPSLGQLALRREILIFFVLLIQKRISPYIFQSLRKNLKAQIKNELYGSLGENLFFNYQFFQRSLKSKEIQNFKTEFDTALDAQLMVTRALHYHQMLEITLQKHPEDFERKFDSFLENASELEKFNERFNSKTIRFYQLSILGDIWFEKRNYDKAENFYLEISALIKKNKCLQYPVWKGKNILDLAKINLAKNKPASAIRLAKNARKNFEPGPTDDSENALLIEFKANFNLKKFQACNQLVKTGLTHPDELNNLKNYLKICVLFAQRKFEQASTLTKKVLKDFPQDAPWLPQLKVIAIFCCHELSDSFQRAASVREFGLTYSKSLKKHPVPERIQIMAKILNNWMKQDFDCLETFHKNHLLFYKISENNPDFPGRPMKFEIISFHQWFSELPEIKSSIAVK